MQRVRLLDNLDFQLSVDIMEYDSLDAIGLKYRTDKSSFFHDYLQFYEIFFSPLRNQPISILEIGVSSGASLDTWEEYFPMAKIVGVDITVAAKRFERERVVIELVDQSNIEELTRIAVKHGPFDIIVEDGSHMWEHQITTLRTLFPFVKNGGLYVVEDLQTNYGSLEQDYRGVATSTCVEYLKSWLDLRVGDDQIAIENVEDAFLRTYGRAAQFLTFYRRACLIKKRFKPVLREPDEGLPLVTENRATGLVEVSAHVSNRGDLFGGNGFINPSSDDYPFQGVSIHVKEKVLEYRVGWPGQSWSDWSQDGEFAGSRGQSRLLTGVTVRLREDARDRFTLQVFCRFAGSNDVLSASDGQDCISPAGRALCGLQVKLTERN